MPDSGSQLAQSQPEAEGPRLSAQILRFQPRGSLSDPSLAALARSPRDPAESESDSTDDDLASFEQERDEEDESINYPRRMLMNVIAVAVVTVLIGIGVWLADAITEMEREQDCVLQGRQNCAPIEVPAPIQQ
jgi:hypothetical protein